MNIALFLLCNFTPWDINMIGVTIVDRIFATVALTANGVPCQFTDWIYRCRKLRETVERRSKTKWISENGGSDVRRRCTKDRA